MVERGGGERGKKRKRDFFLSFLCRYNEWVEESRILRKVTNPTKHARPPYKVYTYIELSLLYTYETMQYCGAGTVCIVASFYIHNGKPEESYVFCCTFHCVVLPLSILAKYV